MALLLKIFNMGQFGSKLLLFMMKGFGRQPWWLLHLESSIIACIMSSFGGYRRKIAIANLTRVFGPVKANKFVSGFYRNFCDITLESMKLFSVSEESLIHRVEYTSKGLKLMNKLYDEDRVVILAGGHMANWEMYAMTFSRKIKFDTMAIYKELSDSIMDQEMRISRERYGLKMVNISELVFYQFYFRLTSLSTLQASGFLLNSTFVFDHTSLNNKEFS